MLFVGNGRGFKNLGNCVWFFVMWWWCDGVLENVDLIESVVENVYNWFVWNDIFVF